MPKRVTVGKSKEGHAARKRDDETVSLHPLDFKDALRGLLNTAPPKEKPLRGPRQRKERQPKSD